MRTTTNVKITENSDDTFVEISNAPVVVWTYTDHVQKCDFVNVAVTPFSGCKGVDFNLSEDGMKVMINFLWPSAIYNANELFKKELNDTKSSISVNDPELHAMTKQLMERGITEKSIPRGKITVTLPMPVQREVGTWTKKAISTVDGTKIVLLKFKGYQPGIIVENADTTIVFD